jgi:hypothetical protein
MSSLQSYIMPAALALLASLYLYNHTTRATTPPSHASRPRRSRSSSSSSSSSSRGDGLSRDRDGSFTCTVASIHAARALLMRRGGLPLELADMILERAEYWAVERSTTQREVSISPRPSLANPGGVDPAACLYLQTAPLAAGEHGLADARFVRCRKVVVRVVARDQGWASDASAHGGYRGAFSWFDASIARADERAPSQELLSPLVTLMAGPFGSEHGNQNQVNRANFYVTTAPEREVHSLARGGWHFVANGDKVVWKVQRNKVAHREYLEHTVVWRDDDEIDDEEDEWPENGNGKGRGFVSSLERGDRILIWARAMVRLIPL